MTNRAANRLLPAACGVRDLSIGFLFAGSSNGDNGG
jgi:hypothetical protein